MKLKAVTLIALLSLVMGLAACGGTPTPLPTATATEKPPATPTEVAVQATDTQAPTPEPTVTPASTLAAEPTAQDTPTPEAEAQAIELEPFSNDAMGIQGLVPQGWQEVAPGVYARSSGPTDLVSIVQQAAPGTTAEQIADLLKTQLGFEELPAPGDSLETDAFVWDLYQIEIEVPGVGSVMIALALAETEQGVYLVLLQASPDEYETLHEAVFVPAVKALAATAPEEEEAEARYEHPDGLFSVPIPTNWTVEELEGYALLTSPDDEILVYVLVVEIDDLEAGITQAWTTVDPTFDLEVAEVIEEPTVTGAERAATLFYDTGDGNRIVLGGGWLYEGIAYLELIEANLEAFQKRAAQVQIIGSGYEIAALEQTNLSNVEPLPLTDELLAEFEAYLVEKMEELDVPGVSLAIVQDGEVVYTKGFGLRDRDTQEPVTPETRMMIGSTTKSMTTMLMAQMVDAGYFTWDTPVVEILPTFSVADPEITEQITMRNMVCACTGVPRRDYEWLFNATELTAEDIIESLADFEFFTDFGEAYQYSNQMVASGGYLATLAAGGEYGTLYDDYLALMQDQILDPLQMSSSTFSFDEVVASGNYATPYGQTAIGGLITLPLETEAMLIPIGPAGALWSNVEDMANYLITELNFGLAPDGTRLVSEENLRITWEPQVDISADASYGLGWIIEDYDGVQVINHNGNTFGFTSELAFLPDSGLGIIILSNQQHSSLNQVVRYRLLELLFQRDPEIEQIFQFQLEQAKQSLAELRDSLLDSIDPDAVAPYLGDYSHEILGDVTLQWQDDALVLDAGEFQTEIRARLNDEDEIDYFTFEPPLAGLPFFLQEQDGKPVLILGRGVVEYTFERVE
jgi:CubicO group peptidase (beta-lactamase class C family)